LQSGSRAVIMPRGDQLQPLLSLVDVEVVLDALNRAPMRASLKNTLRTVPNQIIAFDDNNCFRNVNAPSDMN
ncbi:MAG: hypothetical protein VYB17_04680, partial [Candidatus Thermoplasmatota archaeon]|nr:hypothetical protein [Candidatus Thermoplasmatota archaeon]